MIVWLIGLSGAGKTVIGVELRKIIVNRGHNCVFLDGDIVRNLLGSDLSHSVADREKNADRISRICQYLDTQSINVVCGILSIFPNNRKWNLKNIKNYFEVFIDAPLDMLIERDDKCLYKKALTGKIKNVVGVDIDFPRPDSSHMKIENNFEEKPIILAEKIFKSIADKLH